MKEHQERIGIPWLIAFRQEGTHRQRPRRRDFGVVKSLGGPECSPGEIEESHGGTRSWRGNGCAGCNLYEASCLRLPAALFLRPRADWPSLRLCARTVNGLIL